MEEVPVARRTAEERAKQSARCARADVAVDLAAGVECPGCGRWFQGPGLRAHGAAARRQVRRLRELARAIERAAPRGGSS